MNIEDMQKIWNAQDQKVYYAIDEETLYHQIRKRTSRLRQSVNRDELGLIFITLVTAGLILIMRENSVYNLLIAGMLLLIGVVIFISRRKRIKQEAAYGLTVQDNIEQAITLAKYRLRNAKTFVWWYIIPLALPIIAKLYFKTTDLKTWILIIGAFILSFLVVRWAIVKSYVPGLRKLEKIREQIESQD